MGNETSGQGGGGPVLEDRTDPTRRLTFNPKSLNSSLPLQVIQVEVKSKQGSWTHYTACLVKQKGGYSLEYSNVGDQFAVAMQLSSIASIALERVPGGSGVSIVQGTDPRHNKVTTFRFEAVETARQFISVIQSYQNEERTGQPAARPRGAGSGGAAGESSVGEHSSSAGILRTLSAEEERGIRDLEQKHMAPRAKAAPTEVAAVRECAQHLNAELERCW
jgi:hypothetical protein